MCSWRRTMSAGSSSSWRRRSHRPLAPPPSRQAARPCGRRPREGGRRAVVRSREALRRARSDRSRSLPCTPQRSVARGHRRSDSLEPRFSRSRGPGRRAGETGRRTAASEGRPWAYAVPPGGTRARRRRRSSSGSRCTAKSQVPSRSRRWYSWMSALRVVHDIVPRDPRIRLLGPFRGLACGLSQDQEVVGDDLLGVPVAGERLPADPQVLADVAEHLEHVVDPPSIAFDGCAHRRTPSLTARGRTAQCRVCSVTRSTFRRRRCSSSRRKWARVKMSEDRR